MKSLKRLLVTGATGFTGSYVVPKLLQAGYHVCCFVRPSSDRSHLPDGEQISFVTGDLDDLPSLIATLQQADALVNIASLGFGHAPNLLQALDETAVSRAIFISTTAIFTNLNAPSKKVRLAAEKAIENSPLSYTILRPTMIYGSDRDRNICRLIRYLYKFPILPIFGSGQYLLQPIYVEDVAQAIVKALPNPATFRQAYNISGKAPLTYNQLVMTTANALNQRLLKWHIPAKPAMAVLAQLEKFIPFAIKAEQIARLNENKDFSHTEAQEAFGFAPLTFQEGLQLELKAMQLHL